MFDILTICSKEWRKAPSKNRMKHFPKILLLVSIGVVVALGWTMTIGPFFAPSSEFSQRQLVQGLLSIAEHQKANPRITRVGKGFLIEWLIHSPSEFYKNIHKINSYPNKHLHFIFSDMKIEEPLAEKIEETEGICGMSFCNCRFALDKKHIFKTNLLMFRDMTVSGSILAHFTLMEDSQVILHDCDISNKDFQDFVACKRIKNLLIRTPNTKSLLPVISKMKELQVLFFYDENMGIPDIRLLSQSLPQTEIWVNGENAQELIKANTSTVTTTSGFAKPPTPSPFSSTKTIKRPSQSTTVPSAPLPLDTTKSR
ncbi:MAG: hypothetical protein Q4D98_11170 [Planctomycetia bacterium]|nr:hypothetical protein [Planctomycetia bacterium]